MSPRLYTCVSRLGRDRSLHPSPRPDDSIAVKLVCGARRHAESFGAKRIRSFLRSRLIYLAGRLCYNRDCAARMSFTERLRISWWVIFFGIVCRPSGIRFSRFPIRRLNTQHVCRLPAHGGDAKGFLLQRGSRSKVRPGPPFYGGCARCPCGP
jgi:hypothetical protein